MNTDVWTKRAASAQRESKYVDFKGSFDVDANGEWCELVKDIAAMANSGGGLIIFGLANNGSATGFNARALLAFDPAKVTDKLARYTGRQFSDFDIVPVLRETSQLGALIIGGTATPLVFNKAGTYTNPDGKEKVAFQSGTLYFRHGAKSEPATEDDLADLIEREVERRRRTWLKNIRQIADASTDQEMVIVKRSEVVPSPVNPSTVRIVTAKDAPGVYPANADDHWPLRGKALVSRVNQLLGGRTRINSFDIVAIRHVFDISTAFPHFLYRPFAKSSPQYSEAFAEWLVDKYIADPTFFEKTRSQYRTHTT